MPLSAGLVSGRNHDTRALKGQITHFLLHYQSMQDIQAIRCELQKTIRSSLSAALNLSPSKKKYTGSQRPSPPRIYLRSRNQVATLHLERPITEQFVCNFYNIIGINERAINSSNHYESFLMTLFYIKSIVRTSLEKGNLVFLLKNANTLRTPVQYFVDRYMSFGDSRLSRLSKVFSTFEERKESEPNSTHPQILRTFLEQMADKAFLCKAGMNTIIISRRLIELLEYDIQQLAVQALKQGCLLNEAVSATYYYEIVLQCLDNLGLLIELIQNQITLEQLLERASITVDDYLLTRRHRKIFCTITVKLATPLISCLVVDRVITETNQIEACQARGKRQEIYDQLKCQEVNTLRHIMKLPCNMLAENQGKVCGYKLDQ